MISQTSHALPRSSSSSATTSFSLHSYLLLLHLPPRPPPAPPPPPSPPPPPPPPPLTMLLVINFNHESEECLLETIYSSAIVNVLSLLHTVLQSSLSLNHATVTTHRHYNQLLKEYISLISPCVGLASQGRGAGGVGGYWERRAGVWRRHG